MRKIFAGFMGALGVAGVVGFLILSLFVIGFYVRFFKIGAWEWFGWSGWWVGVLGFVLLLMFRELGFIVVAIIGGYGAYYGRGWDLIWVIVVFFPGFAFVLGALIVSALASLGSRAK